MKILWIDLNSSYAHSSLALPALHAQIADDTSIEWASVSATINENIGTIVEEAYRHKPDILAATAWLFNHEQLLHITSRLKALLPETCLILGGPEFLGDNEFFLRKILCELRIQRRRRRSLSPVAVMLEPSGTVEYNLRAVLPGF